MQLEALSDSLLGAPKQKIFRISYRGRESQPEVKFIKAASEAEAVATLGVNRNRIDDIRRDLYRELDARMPKSAPPLALQAQITSVFAAQVSAGLNASQVFDRLLRNFPIFKQQLPDVVRAQRVSEKLRMLKFDNQLVLLAEVGEESGMIGEVLGNAADEIIERQKILSAMKSKIIPGALLALAGILVAQALPIFMVEPFDQISNARGIKMTVNSCTTIMMFLGRLFSDPVAWYVQGALIAALYFTRRIWWPTVANLPVLRMIEGFFKILNSYRFISAFYPLYSRGVNIERSISLLHRHAKGPAKQAYEQMQRHLASGGSMGGAFESPYFDPMLRDCMRGFDTMKSESKLELLRRISPLMAHTVAKAGEQIGNVLGMFGLAVSVGVTLVVFLGLTLPLLTVTTNVAG